MATLASLTDAFGAVLSYIIRPLREAEWGAWRTFWLERLFDDRFVVVYFLPLVFVLLLFPRHRLRMGVVLTGLAFMAYVFGVLYAGLWLLTVVVFYWIAERFAVESQRKDVLQIGPPLAMGAIFGGWYLCTMLLHKVKLSGEQNAWLLEHLPWIFPLGVRGWAWEPHLRLLDHTPAIDDPPQLVFTLFWNVHNIGTAYLLIRMFQYLSEIKRGNLPREQRTLSSFLAFTCYAPTLIQGPIERYARFQEEMDTCHERRSWWNVPPAMLRIAIGISKSVVGTLYFLPLLRDTYGLGGGDVFWKNPEQIESFWLLYLGVFFQIFWLYLEFSGYCDVAAGIARLLGYRQVENFRMPWIATSLRDFWRRWHISLSFIVRDYIYIPMGGNRRHTTLNLCVAFFLVGIWHFLIPRAAIWGIVMGLMIAVNQYWVGWMKRLDERTTGTLPAVRRGWLKLRPLPQICAWLITQHVFVFSLLIFFGGSGAYNVMREIVRRVWVWLT